MSEHAWSQDHIAAHVAGGLDPAEAERLEAHVRECPACAAALADARSLDRSLGSLFAPARPGPALEDRAIRSMHVIRAADVLRPRWKRQVLWGVAASVGLGLTAAIGAGMTNLTFDGPLPFPGTRAENHLLKVSQSLSAVSASTDAIAKAAKVDTSNGEARLHSSTMTDNSPSMSDPDTMARELREKANQWGRIQATDRVTDLAVQAGDGSAKFADSQKGVDERQAFNKSVGELSSFGFAVDAPAANQSNSRTDHLWKVDNGRSAPTWSDQASTSERKKKEPPAIDHYSFAPPQHKPAVEYMFEAERRDKSHLGRGNELYGMPAVTTPSNPPGESTTATAGVPPSDPKPAARPAPVTTADPVPEPLPAAARKIIRSGEIDFEIESFDSAVAGIIKLVTAIKGGYVGTVNSEKLANGKVKGSVVVRVPPDSLDSLVLDLRRDLGKGGELKGQRIGSQDITKQYTDIESRLKAAKTMETRLLQIIKEGKGEIKQLLEAEKELGVWRTRIEEMEGELRYYASQVSLSTLTITLAEKEIKSAAGLTESERVQAGIEVDDVEKAQQQLLAAVAEAKGRVTKSEMKQLGAGQFNSTVNFEVAPEQAGALRDRLRQLGVVARLEIDRVQQAEGGTPPKDTKDIKVKRGDTIFAVQLYNIARMTARETATMQVAAPDVPAAYRTLQDAVARAKGRVLTAKLDEQDRRNVTAQFDFEVRRSEESAVQAAFAAAGDVVSRTVARAAEDDNTTEAKVLFRTTLMSAARLNPRETTTLAIEVADVDQAAAVFAAQVNEAGGRVVGANIAHERSGRVTARLIYDVPLSAAGSLAERFKTAGTVRVQQTDRDPRAHDGKLAVARVDVTLSNSDLIVPRDEGIWPQLRHGLSWSARVLLVSLSWLVVGLCVVLPWGLLGYAGYRIVRRLIPRAAEEPAAPIQPATPTARADG